MDFEKSAYKVLLYLVPIVIMITIASLFFYIAAERVIIAHKIRKKKYKHITKERIRKVVRRFVSMHKKKLLRERHEKRK